MAADNNQSNSPANPISNATDSSQESWLEFDQQGQGGETLKAKKWSAKSRVVDNNQHMGNIHTGTDQDVELDKGAPAQSDISMQQTAVKESDQEFQSIDNEFVAGRNDYQQEGEAQQQADQQQSSAERTQQLSAESNITKGSAAAAPVFDEHFDEADVASRQSDSGQSRKLKTQATVPEVEPPVTTVAKVEEEQETTPESDQDVAPPLPDSPTVGTPPPTEEEEIESDASTPILQAADAYGIEDTAIPIEVSSQLTDTDGSESLSITISGVPQGASLSAGSDMGGGSWQLSPGQLNGLMIVAEHFPGWDDFAALTSHIRFVREHHQKIRRIAFVTADRVLSAVPRFASRFVDAEVRAFAMDQRDEAHVWVSES